MQQVICHNNNKVAAFETRKFLRNGVVSPSFSRKRIAMYIDDNVIYCTQPPTNHRSSRFNVHLSLSHSSNCARLRAK